MAEKTDHDMLVEMHAVLMGTNGNPGMCDQVRKNTGQINRLWIAIIVIVMSIGGGTWGIVEAILKIKGN
jgi:ABC-type uncharacterized transport system permease subunit